MKLSSSTLAAFILITPAISHADLYKCTDGGKTKYQSSPCQTGDSKPMEIKKQSAGKNLEALEIRRRIEADLRSSQLNRARIASEQSTAAYNYAAAQARLNSSEADHRRVDVLQQEANVMQKESEERIKHYYRR